MTSEDGPGRLVVVGTPIGNLGDLALARPRNVLGRRGRRLLRGHSPHPWLTEPCRNPGRDAALPARDNEDSRIGEILDAVRDGRTVVMVSDAGMPLVSDPGARLVAAVVEAGLDVSAVPGPSAVTGALAVSGLPAGRFCFEGFLPRSGRARREALGSMGREQRTVVLFEAPDGSRPPWPTSPRPAARIAEWRSFASSRRCTSRSGGARSGRRRVGSARQRCAGKSSSWSQAASAKRPRSTMR